MKSLRKRAVFGVSFGVLVAASLVWGACAPVGPTLGNGNNGSDQVDDDGDGFSESAGDCDDHNPNIGPGAVEVVDGIDNNCDGLIDDDLDGDGYGVAMDCDDTNAAINPLAPEDCWDNIDNNCNGLVDGQETDQDGDGFGPCDTFPDCNDNNILIGPASIEDPTDGVDNDCDGGVDEDEVGCDCGGEPGGVPIEEQMLKAIGLCNPAIIQSATLSGNPLGYGAFDNWGAIGPRISTQADDGLPTQNCKWAYLSSGAALDADPQGSMSSDLGVFMATDPAPASGQDGAMVNDLTQFIVTLKVPINVTGFSFDFIFFSSEYPEWVCSEFNDTFYALVDDEPQLNGGQRTNISFDNQQNEITVNNGFFEPAPNWTVSIAGTGYEVADSWASCGTSMIPGCTVPNPCPAYLGSTTGWLRTTTPLTPGETVTLTFSVHDEGDSVLDSAVVIDNFRWQTVPIDGPGTVK